ncbi:Os04g0532200 [Oryza sativa Japonica Group]|uniref:Os04g0532200 protein n=3 Tax=Oryza sativa TaxID=4530 RepID=A0A0P0WCW4_ORYSJ|nr:hypothetical protein OsI_16761 [Oryza sativa Indica Group]EEE61400.1 hypothetical protein OsJ_15576 [Oryza sativa Japonica Group]KAB8096230.1 hypothetical protein EE612_024586 [Oryza sativa]KAF2935075.1 hypothetical protein DAI22_04g206450 [Oryza sativa Japonica Group]BAF15317.1 Os04g0532200 [Oryza sativa Japonica Group]|eukprot:NP_001053403.1 Os04g0532200 [Oryza sativa Japonica Group]
MTATTSFPPSPLSPPRAALDGNQELPVIVIASSNQLDNVGYRGGHLIVASSYPADPTSFLARAEVVLAMQIDVTRRGSASNGDEMEPQRGRLEVRGRAVATRPRALHHRLRFPLLTS